jgi:hypothetical protein
VIADRALIGLHACALLLAFTAALAWPRSGQAALMVPIGHRDVRAALRWADAEQAPLLALDPARGRVIARLSSNDSVLRALASGLVPVAARAPGCQPQAKR